MDRPQRLLATAREQGVDAVVIVPGANLRYLSGLDYHAGERLSVTVFPTTGEPAFVLPSMEAVRVPRLSSVNFRLYAWSDAEPAGEALRKCAQDLRLAGKTIAVEHLGMRVFELRALEAAAPGARFVDANPLMTKLRIVKDADEIAAMREAARMIDASLERLLPQIKPGMTEREVAAAWVREMTAVGSEGPSFDTIVATGPNGAFPHHTTGDRRLQQGDLVILDGGCRHRGYASDITRTVALGPPREELARIYDAVKKANEAGRSASSLGTTGQAIDAATRRVIEDLGFGKHFLHRTGHGLGLDVHEPPYIASGEATPLPAGCVFTIEPGVYVEGVGGTRIEDDVLLTDAGPVSLTNFRRDLVIL